MALRMALSFDPHALQVTRQHLSEAIRVPPETIAYWLKEGLIFALGKPKLGRGNHRRFGYEAVHIAAVLAELSRYGMNTNGLRNLSSLLWEAVKLGRHHSGFTTHDLYCCKNLLSGKEIAEQGGKVPDHKNIEMARTRDSSSIDPNRGAICIPSLRHVKMMEWFDVKSARLLIAYSDLMGDDAFLLRVGSWYVARAHDGSFELIVESDPWGRSVDELDSYICLNIAKILRRTWMAQATK
jgi:DNA-binding transcriptional MerR regulator